jgi:hypothetical protein
VTNEAPIVVVEKEFRRPDIVSISLTRVGQLLTFMDEALSVGFEAELSKGRGIFPADFMGEFFGCFPGFDPALFFRRADLVAVTPRVQDPSEIIGTSVSLIERQPTSKLNDFALEAVRGALGHLAGIIEKIWQNL